MSPVPPPIPSPEPQASAGDSPSGVHRVAVLANGTAFQTKVQWGLIGGLVVGIGTFLNFGLTKLDLVNSAQAQVSIQSTTNAARIAVVEQRVETNDAGRAADNQRIERKVDAIAENVDKKLTDLQASVNAMLREQRAARR